MFEPIDQSRTEMLCVLNDKSAVATLDCPASGPWPCGALDQDAIPPLCKAQTRDDDEEEDDEDDEVLGFDDDEDEFEDDEYDDLYEDDDDEEYEDNEYEDEEEDDNEDEDL